MGEVNNNSEKNRFEHRLENRIAVSDYIFTIGGRIVLTQTGVPKAIGGQGVGSKLAKATFSYAKENDLKVTPLCPFMASYVRRHRNEYAAMIALGFNV